MKKGEIRGTENKSKKNIKGKNERKEIKGMETEKKEVRIKSKQGKVTKDDPPKPVKKKEEKSKKNFSVFG